MPKNEHFSSADLEKACSSDLKQKAKEFDTNHNPVQGAKDAADELIKALDETIKLAEQHKMTKLKTQFGIPFYTPILAIRQGKEIERKIKDIQSKYTNLPPAIRDRRISEFFKTQVSPHRGQKSALASDISGVAAVGLGGGAILATGGVAAIPLGVGALLSGAVSAISGVIAWHKNLTGVADATITIDQLREMKAQLLNTSGQLPNTGTTAAINSQWNSLMN
jgi:hypothetical protein